MSNIEFSLDGKTIKARVFQKTDTLENWLANTNIIGPGEQAFVIGESGQPINFKIGDGTKTFSELPYWIRYDQAAYIQYTDTPTEDVAYTIVGTGTYGSITVANDEMAILSWDGSSWSSQIIDLPEVVPDGEVKEGDVKAVSGGVVFDNLKPLKDAVGIDTILSGTNLVGELVGSSLSDESLWEVGSIRNTDGNPNNTEFALLNYHRTKKFYELPPNTILTTRLALENSPNNGYALYDENFNFISGATRSSAEFDLITPDIDKVYIKFSFRNTYNTNILKLVLTQNWSTYGDSIFLTKDTSKFDELKDELEDYTDTEFSNFGFSKIPAGINVFQLESQSQLTDTNFWEPGYLNAVGDIDAQLRNYHNKEFRRVYEGQVYEFRLYFYNAKRFVIYNKNFVPILIVASPETTQTFIGEITIPEGGYYVRTSHDVAQSFVPSIYFRNKNIIYINPNEDSSDILKIVTTVSRNRTPKAMVSFISDDCYRQNEWFIDVLNEKDVKATFAVITGGYRGIYPKDAPNPSSFLTKSRLIELYKDGHDLAGHTVYHPRTAELTPAEQDFEIGRCKIDLLDFTDNPNVFVAPFGNTSIEMERIVRGYFDCAARNSHNYSYPDYTDAINYSPIDAYRLKRMSFDAEVPDVLILNELKNVVDTAYENDGWIIFTIHPQYAEYNVATSTGLARRQELRDLIDYIKSLDIPILTATKALQIQKNNIEIGNQRLDNEYCVVGMDGTVENNLI